MAVAGQLASPRMVQVARAALHGLTPVVVVNRRADTAIDQVDGASSEPFPTIHTDERRDLGTTLRRTYRTVNERIRGTYGEGDLGGHTVYGSLRFVPTTDAQDGASSVMQALAAQGDVGVRAYGPVSFVVRPDVLQQRTTFAARDTGVSTARVRPPSELASVLAERLEHAGSTDQPDPATLLRLPTAAASDAVRGWLLSDALGSSDGYIEAQVRRLSPADVQGVVVDERDQATIQRRSQVDPGPTPDGDHLARLEADLRRHGIPLHRHGDAT